MGQTQEKALIDFEHLSFGFYDSDGYNLLMLFESAFGLYKFLMAWWITNWRRYFDVLTDGCIDVIISNNDQLA